LPLPAVVIIAELFVVVNAIGDDVVMLVPEFVPLVAVDGADVAVVPGVNFINLFRQ
jgi:hypothetical protein